MTTHDPAPINDDQEQHDSAQDQEQGDSARPRSARASRYAETAARGVAGHIGAGLRHGWQLVVHWSAAQYMSDDEIRRRLVKKHLDRYVEQREEAAMHIRRLGKKTAKLSQDAAHYGFTTQEAMRLRDMTAELRRYHTAGTALSRIEFDRELVQPTKAQIRRVRTIRALVRFTGVVLPVAGAAAVLMFAVPTTLLGIVPAVVGGAWWLGRHPIELTHRALAPELIQPELEPLETDQEEKTTEATDAPYPLADATTAAEAQEALRRALVAARQDIASVTRAKEEPWGWSMYVRWRSGGPDDLRREEVYRDVVTRLELRRAGLLPEGDPENGACATVRLVQHDPFTPELVGPVPYRAPLSMSIQDRADYGVGMDADPLLFTLAGLMLLMVADSGGGKSGIMLAMAEVVTACRDAVVINVDPVGTGVGDLGPAITLNAYWDEELIYAVLRFLHDLCKSRTRLRARYGWGNKWRPSAEHPAFVVFVDEWPELSDRCKALLISLYMLGRKEAVWIIGGSQFATKDYLGGPIAAKVSGKMIGSARGVDVTEMMGSGALAAGYRADLLQPATHTARNDAGQIYAQGLPGMPERPMRYQVREISSDYAAKVGAERAEAGLPSVEHTLTEAGLWDAWTELLASSGEEPPQVPAILAAIRDAFREADDPEALSQAEIHAHLRTVDAEFWGQWDDMQDARARGGAVGRAIRKACADAGVTLPSERLTERPNKPTGYRLKAVLQAIEEHEGN